MTQNITVEAQQGATTHGYPTILCSPAQWTNILLFFVSNFVTHAATVVIYPGESIFVTVGVFFTALLLPTAGGLRGLDFIFRRARFPKTSLQRAARAGALCMVVRTKSWEIGSEDAVSNVLVRGPLRKSKTSDRHESYPEAGESHPSEDSFVWPKTEVWTPEKIFKHDVESTEDVRSGSATDLNGSFSTTTFWPAWASSCPTFWDFNYSSYGRVHESRKVNGSYKLAKGYALAHVPEDAIVRPLRDDIKDVELAEDFNTSKALFAIVQLVFSLIQLSQAAGSEVMHYGYASFSLTVAPYALMSLVNLIANAVTPSYSCMYMVKSSVMDEAIYHGSSFEAVIARLVEQDFEVKNSGPECFMAMFRGHDNFLCQETLPEKSILPPGDSEHDLPVLDLLHSFALRSLRVAPPDGFRNLRKIPKLFLSGSLFRQTEPFRVAETSEKCSGLLPVDEDPPALLHAATRSPLLFHRAERKNKSYDQDGLIMVPAFPNILREKDRSFFALITNRRVVFWGRRTRLQKLTQWPFPWWAAGAVGLLPIAINGAFSGFNRKNSSFAQRLITMGWLAVNVASGPAMAHHINAYLVKQAQKTKRQSISFADVVGYAFAITIFGGGVSFAGFVIVGMMIKEWGSCISANSSIV